MSRHKTKTVEKPAPFNAGQTVDCTFYNGCRTTLNRVCEPCIVLDVVRDDKFVGTGFGLKVNTEHGIRVLNSSFFRAIPSAT